MTDELYNMLQKEEAAKKKIKETLNSKGASDIPEVLDWENTSAVIDQLPKGFDFKLLTEYTDDIVFGKTLMKINLDKFWELLGDGSLRGGSLFEIYGWNPEWDTKNEYSVSIEISENLRSFFIYPSYANDNSSKQYSLPLGAELGRYSDHPSCTIFALPSPKIGNSDLLKCKGRIEAGENYKDVFEQCLYVASY